MKLDFTDMNNSEDFQITVCIVEDRIDIREALFALVDSQPNCSVLGAFENAEDALKAIPELQPNVVLIILRRVSRRFCSNFPKD